MPSPVNIIRRILFLKEAMKAHFKTITDYMGWEDVGSVIAPDIWTAGSIKGTKYAVQAYELGKRL